MLKTDNKPDGVPQSVFDEMIENTHNDRPGFLNEFGKQFYGVNLPSHPVSEAFLNWSQMMASLASSKAMLDGVHSSSATDFRADMTQIKAPTLVIHGDSDKTVPIEASGDRTSKLIAGAHYIVHAGAPHGFFYTERDQLNKDLLAFIAEQVPVEKVLY